MAPIIYAYIYIYIYLCTFWSDSSWKYMTVLYQLKKWKQQLWSFIHWLRFILAVSLPSTRVALVPNKFELSFIPSASWFLLFFKNKTLQTILTDPELTFRRRFLALRFSLWWEDNTKYTLNRSDCFEAVFVQKYNKSKECFQHFESF